MGCEDMKT